MRRSAAVRASGYSSGELKTMKLSVTLQRMADLGMDVCRKTTTTTDFSTVDTEELAQALETGHSDVRGWRVHHRALL